MKFLKNWREVLGSAWSVRLLMVSVVFNLFAAWFLAQPQVSPPFGLTPSKFLIWSAVISALATVARIVQQVTVSQFVSGLLSRWRKDTSGAVRRGIVVAAFTATSVVGSVGYVAKYEGLRLTPYLDSVGVLTVCHGATDGVAWGDRYTPEECRDRLEHDLATHARELGACLHADMPPGMAHALQSWVYNVGAYKACHINGGQPSTLVRKANAGDLLGACNELLRWDKGRVNGKLVAIRGLTNRRRAEHEMCVGALRDAGLI